MVTLEQDLVRSAANARDVIESYRRSHVAISGWSTLLQEAVESFTRISAQRPVVGESVALAQLARALQDTADARLQVDRGTLDQLSRALRSIVTAIRIPGIPARLSVMVNSSPKAVSPVAGRSLAGGRNSRCVATLISGT